MTRDEFVKKTAWACLFCFLPFLPDPGQCLAASRRGLFVSVIQDPPVLSSRAEIGRLVDFAKKSGAQILFVQIYRANQAWFPSETADSKPYEQCLKSVSEDPFRLLIREAHSRGIEVHAWLNLLSLSANENAPLLKKYGTDILTRNTKPKKILADYKIDDQYFLEPGDWRVRKELSALVEEVLRAYPELDGIQFDYIRYPDKNPAYGHTKINVERFEKATGEHSPGEKSRAWKKWKRDQVTALLELLVKKTRSLRPNIQVSTTALVRYSRANLEAFQDWRLWLKRGLVNFVTLMCYSKEIPEFKKDISDAKKQMGDLKKVNIAVGAYALLDAPETFRRQWEICEESDSRACVVLHYGSFLENPVLTEPLTAGPDSN